MQNRPKYAFFHPFFHFSIRQMLFFFSIFGQKIDLRRKPLIFFRFFFEKFRFPPIFGPKKTRFIFPFWGQKSIWAAKKSRFFSRFFFFDFWPKKSIFFDFFFGKNFGFLLGGSKIDIFRFFSKKKFDFFYFSPKNRFSAIFRVKNGYIFCSIWV